MVIDGKITGIKYEIKLLNNLKVVEASDFDINKCPTACFVSDGKTSFAVSKWVSPKRTRSYPYERVYNTLNIAKKITVIPIVKDEGATGDRDFIQWDTVSLMSLLDVFVIFAFYNKAEKRGLKITKQQFDADFVASKIKEIEHYRSSALHWNLKELNKELPKTLEKVVLAYTEIEQKTGVKLHSFQGLDNFKAKIGKDVATFMAFSRQKASEAQSREFQTIQPKESLDTATKAKITITNYLGGQYFLTVDEIELMGKNVFLIESKHSRNSFLPSRSDIKDGLLKMILYANLTAVEVNNAPFESQAVLKLTSSKIIGQLDSTNSDDELNEFMRQNKISSVQKQFIIKLLDESRTNGFTVKIQNAV
jgi:hypothetical protein